MIFFCLFLMIKGFYLKFFVLELGSRKNKWDDKWGKVEVYVWELLRE